MRVIDRLRGSHRLVLVTLAIVLVALVLRSPIVAVAPVVGDIRSDLALTPAVAGLLTSVPVLCFAVFSPLATLVTNRAGTAFAVTACALGTAVGCVIRSLAGDGPSGAVALFAGTLVMGVAIAIGNIAVPVVIRREYAGRAAGIMTGVYTSVLNVGSMIATLATAPFADAAGWRLAIAAWLVVALAGVLAVSLVNGWRPMLEPTPMPHVEHGADGPPPSALRSLPVWLLAIAFGGQAFSYYAITAWLPSLLAEEEHYSATASGGIAAIFQVCAILGAVLVPVISHRFSGRTAAAVIGILWVITPVGFLVAPQLWVVWCVLGGAAQGGGFTAVFTLIVQLGRSDRHVGAISGLVQGIAYVIGAAGPFAIGGLRTASGGWTLPLLVVLVATLVYLSGSLVAATLVRRRG